MKRSLTYIKPGLANMGRHLAAITSPQGPEKPIVHLLLAWEEYADMHERRYGRSIGDDGVLGPAWAEIGLAIRALLNGESGRLDCHLIDGYLLDNLSDKGFPEI